MYDKKYIDRFWDRVDKSGDCWIWQGTKHIKGYGAFYAGGNKGNTLTHRFVYEITHGVLPKDMNVCHKCDNPICVNPDHLFLGTQRDNIHDMIGKDRHNPFGLRGKNGYENWHGTTIAVGEHPSIRSRYAAGGILQRELAAEYGVSRRTMWAIIHDRPN